MTIVPQGLAPIFYSPVFWAVISGLLCALGLQPWGLIPSFVAGYSILLYLVFHAKTPLKAFCYGWLHGFTFHCIGLYWISNALLVDFNAFWWALPFSFFGLPIVLAFFNAVAAWIAAAFAPPAHLARFLAFVALSGAMDYVRGVVFTGFPWNLAGSIWIDIDNVAQFSSVAGLYGLSALTYVWAALPITILCLPRHYTKSYILITCFTGISFLWIYMAGYAHINSIPHPSEGLTKDAAPALIHIVQPNIPQREKWDPDHFVENFTKHLELSYPDPEYFVSVVAQEQGATPTSRPTLIIWPETSISYIMLNQDSAKDAIRRVLTDIPGPTYLATGYLDRQEIKSEQASEQNGEQSGEQREEYYNSLIVLDENADIIAKYDKHHLVPFGEYMPYEDRLGWLPLVQVGGFQKGAAPAPIKFDDAIPSFIPSICYEIIFPRYLQKAAKTGLILNVTNDGWYGDSAGPQQHLVQARFRAIEQSAHIIRAANTGVSALIDPRGRIIEKIAYGNPGTITYGYEGYDAPLNFYQKYDVIPVLIFLGLIFALSLAARLIVK